MGQTSRIFFSARKHELSIKKKSSTALSSIHGFNFDGAVFLMKIDNTYKRLLAEKFFIKTYGQRALNFQADCIGLINAYLSILYNDDAQL